MITNRDLISHIHSLADKNELKIILPIIKAMQTNFDEFASPISLFKLEIKLKKRRSFYHCLKSKHKKNIFKMAPLIQVSLIQKEDKKINLIFDLYGCISASHSLCTPFNTMIRQKDMIENWLDQSLEINDDTLPMELFDA